MIEEVKKFSCVVLTLLVVVGVLSACQPDTRTQLNIYNVGDYINEDVIDLFEKVKEMLLEVNCDLSMVSFKTI